jgi:hypothetical protein
MAATDIIFNIGTTGADGAVSAIGKVTTSLVQMGKVIFNEVKEAERFSQVLKRVEVDMSTFGQETQGLIDTLESFKGANTLTNAGLKATSDEINTVGKAAIELARSIDGDATQAFAKLTNDIAKGSSRGLKQLGIDMEDLVEDSATLEEKQRAALDAIMSKYGELSIELETAEERAFRLSNAIGTLKPQLVGAAFKGFQQWAGDTFDTVGKLTKNIEFFSDAMFKTNGLMGDFLTTTEGANFAFEHLVNTVGSITGFEKFDNNLDVLNRKLSETTVKLMAVSRAGNVFKRVFGEAIGAPADTTGRAGGKGKIKKIGRRGVGGGKKETPVDLDFNLSDADVIAASAVSDTFGEFGAASGRGGIAGHEQAQIAAAQAAAAQRVGIARQMAQDIIAEEERLSAQRKTQTIEGMKLTSTAAKQWASVADTSSKKGFAANKALRLADVAVTTPMAALNSFNQGMAMGGPILAGILAANAVALGIATAANISKQKYKGSSGPSKISVSKPSIGGAFAGGPSRPGGDQINLTTKVVVDGQVIHESLLNVVDSKSQQGQETLVKSGV